LLSLYSQIIESLIRNISGRVGTILRRKYYSKRFASCGQNLQIEEGVIIQGAKDIYVGDNVWIDKYCILMAGKLNIPSEQVKVKQNKNYIYNEGELHVGSNVHIAPQCIIQAHGGVSIGDNCGFSSGVKIYSLTNLPESPNNDIIHFTPLGKPYYLNSQISIAENVGIALNSIVLTGVTIEQNSFIAPNSVVMTTIKENSFASGSPAKKIKDRFKNYGEKI
jgi:acetyltransferase-like isoleucine patch superfamily enzyme